MADLYEPEYVRFRVSVHLSEERVSVPIKSYLAHPARSLRGGSM